MSNTEFKPSEWLFNRIIVDNKLLCFYKNMQSVLESNFMGILEGTRFRMDFQPSNGAPEKREVVELVT